MANNITDLTGQEVAHYHIKRRIGGGVLAGVYEATDLILEKTVALKVLLISADDLMRQRFRQEARTGSLLEHPHVVQTLQVGQTASDGIAYIAMELVRGQTLSELLENHPVLSIMDASNVLEPVARALCYAHGKGIVHRDVKPSNILLRHVEAGTPNSVQLSILDAAVVPLLSDFGISLALDSPNLTNAGRTIGTPSYMAPEQCAGSREVDGRADIYSLGTVLYRCLVGRAPYVGTTTQVLHAHVYEPLTLPDDILEALPDSVVDVLKKSLAKEPEDRYQNVRAMSHDLSQTTSTTASPSSLPTAPQVVLPPLAGTADDDSAAVVGAENVISSFGKSSDAPIALAGERVADTLHVESEATEHITPTKLPRVVPPIKRTSTSHPRVTRPLPPRPVTAVPKKRNWAGFVIGGALMLVILFAGIAAFRTVWPTNPEFAATSTTATIENGGEVEAEAEVVQPTGNKIAETANIASVNSSSEDDSEAVAAAEAERSGSTTDSPAESTTESTDSETETSNAAHTREADAVAEASVELAGHWEDVQFFHEQRNWQDAADSLTLMRKIDESFEPDELDSMQFNIFTGVAALQMQGMLLAEPAGTDADDSAVMDRQQLALVAGYYDDALQIDPDSNAASDLLRALDSIAETTSSDSQPALSDDVIKTLQNAYADFSASLALQGNYCNAVEQLGIAVLIDHVVLLENNNKQMAQLENYVDTCEDPTDILTRIEDKRRARQVVASAELPSVAEEDVNEEEESARSTAETESTSSTTAAQVSGQSRTEEVAPTATPHPQSTRPANQPSAQLTQLTQPTVRAEVSRNALSGRILYSSVDEGMSKIWSISAAPDADAVSLVESARLPTMHPNGQLVTFHSDQGFKEGVRGFDLLGTMSLPEGQFIQFIYHPEASQFSPPTWSPAGNKMLFSSTVDADRVPRIYSALNNNRGDYLYIAHGREPDWHPFDDLIVYKGADETGNRSGLWLMNSSGRNQQIFSDNAGDSRPVWTANGSHIIFMSNGRSSNWDIFSANYETRAVQQLTVDSANDGLPTVSPDGKHVAFLSNRSGIWQIWVVSVSGGTPQLLAPIRGALPNWLEQAIHWIQ